MSIGTKTRKMMLVKMTMLFALVISLPLFVGCNSVYNGCLIGTIEANDINIDAADRKEKDKEKTEKKLEGVKNEDTYVRVEEVVGDSGEESGEVAEKDEEK